MRLTVILTATLLVTACTNEAADTKDENISSSSDGERSTAVMNAEGKQIGTVSLREEPSGVMVSLDVSGLEPGMRAVHLHETGDCSASDFTSAGGHWNPEGKSHGRANKQGAHLGDLANLMVAEDGTGSSRYLLTGVRLSEGDVAIDDVDGTALVLHERADDYRSDPAGEAGARIACSVVSTAG